MPGCLCKLHFKLMALRQAQSAASLPNNMVVFNCRQGVYGWRLDPNVKAYSSYEQWEAPPDPENVQVGTQYYNIRIRDSSMV